ncbi:MAG: Ig-like domain-containing protein [Clostridia bacterium]|nr:Ig-like domain-containing protein [Clostridia bacterium]
MEEKKQNNQLIDFWAEREFERELGHGLYGEVYLESRVEMDEKFLSASKIIRIPDEEKHPLAELEKSRPDDVPADRWLHRIASGLNRRLSLIREMRGRDNVVFLEDFKTIRRKGGYTFYIRSELLTPFEEHLKNNPPDKNAAVRFCVAMSRALACFERAGILHRDIKPSNVFVDSAGEFRLGDTGIPQLGLPDGEFAAPGSEKDPVGKMSDEIYSVCAVARKLFSLSGRMEAICARGCSEDPSRRFRTLDQFQKALLKADEDTALVGYDGENVKAVEKLNKKRSSAALIGLFAVIAMIALSAVLYTRLTILFATKTDPATVAQILLENRKLNTDADGNVTLIDLVGKNFEQAKKLLENHGLSVQKAVAFDSGKVGKVISQSVRAGETAAPGEQVWLLVGSADQRDSTRRIESIIVDRTEISILKDESVTPAVTVLPKELEKSQLIWLSSDESVVSVVSGTLTGVSIGDAKVTLKDNTGLVRTVVTVHVLDNAIAVPDLAGVSEEQALSTLGELGFAAESEYVYTTDDDMYRVVSQDPAPGTVLPYGSVVGMTVSLGELTPDRIPVTGVSLSEEEITLNAGGSFLLEAIIEPRNASNTAVSWLSTNKNVATVTPTGIVTAVANGEAVIKAVTADGSKTATCKVTVQTLTYAIYYSANGGTGTTESSYHVYSVPKALNECGFTRKGYEFLGWSLTPDSLTAQFADCEEVNDLGDLSDDGGTVTLYAIWTPLTYEIYFNAQGGTLSRTTMTVTYGKRFGFLETPVKNGYMFEGWFSNPTVGVKVEKDTVVSYDTPTVLYAHWAKVSEPILITQVPEGAEIVEGSDQWIYDRVSSKTVTQKVNEEGWRLIGESDMWIVTEEGETQYAELPEGFDLSASIAKRYSDFPPEEYSGENRKVEYIYTELAGYIYWHWSERYTGGALGSSSVSDFRTDEYTDFSAFFSPEIYQKGTPEDGTELYYADRSYGPDVSRWWFGGEDLPVYETAFRVSEFTHCYEYEVTEHVTADSEPEPEDGIVNVGHYVRCYLEQEG